MRKLEYPQPKLEIPKGKFVLMVRDNKMHFHNGGSIFEPCRRTNSALVYEKDIKDTDRIYVLDKEEDITATVIAGRCLENHRIKTTDAQSGIRRQTIIKALKDGKCLGYYDGHGEKLQFKLVGENPTVYRYNKDKKEMNTTVTWYDNIGPDAWGHNVWVGDEFEFWKWFLDQPGLK